MIELFLAQLRGRYGEAAIATRRVADTLLIRIVGLVIPRRSVTTDGLIEVADGSLERGERPKVYAREDTVQPNGQRGKNVNPIQVHGETWLTFSWSHEWTTNMPAWILMEGAIRRFSIDED